MSNVHEKPFSRRQENGVDKRSSVNAMLKACEGLEDLEDCMNAAYDALQQTDLLQEAIRLLSLQQDKLLYKMDEQIKTSNQVKQFIERYANDKK